MPLPPAHRRAKTADRHGVALVRSPHTGRSNHDNATPGMHTGSFAVARPSYGPGTANKNLPSFPVLAPQTPYAGTRVWAAALLPAAHQGTRIVPGAEPVANLTPRVPEVARRRLELDTLKAFNEQHLAPRQDDRRWRRGSSRSRPSSGCGPRCPRRSTSRRRRTRRSPCTASSAAKRTASAGSASSRAVSWSGAPGSWS